MLIPLCAPPPLFAPSAQCMRALLPIGAPISPQLAHGGGRQLPPQPPFLCLPRWPSCRGQEKRTLAVVLTVRCNQRLEQRNAHQLPPMSHGDRSRPKYHRQQMKLKCYAPESLLLQWLARVPSWSHSNIHIGAEQNLLQRHTYTRD